MKTMTVKFPDELAIRLEKRAKRLGVSKSAFVRQSVEAAFSESDLVVEEEPSMYEMTRDDCGSFDSGISDLSTNPIHMEGFGR